MRFVGEVRYLDVFFFFILEHKVREWITDTYRRDSGRRFTAALTDVLAF